MLLIKNTFEAFCKSTKDSLLFLSEIHFPETERAQAVENNILSNAKHKKIIIISWYAKKKTVACYTF